METTKHKNETGRENADTLVAQGAPFAVPEDLKGARTSDMDQHPSRE